MWMWGLVTFWGGDGVSDGGYEVMWKWRWKGVVCGRGGLEYWEHGWNVCVEERLVCCLVINVWSTCWGMGRKRMQTECGDWNDGCGLFLKSSCVKFVLGGLM